MTLLTGTTLAALQAGSFRGCWVASIEGYPKLLSDCGSSSAVLAAYAGTAWDSGTYSEVGVTGGLFVELKNSQQADPWQPFTRGGTLILKVMPLPGDDTFGIDVARRAHGAETSLQSTIDRDDTSIAVASNSAFTAAPANAYIGTECIRYSGMSSTTMTASQRGMFSPFKTGTGANNYSQHHRVGLDPSQVMMNPVVSQDPRVWAGRRVALRWHKWDGTSLNSRDDALLVFAGRIASISDDKNSGCAIVEVKHELDKIADTVILHDQFSAQIPDGIYTSGATVAFTEIVVSTAGAVTTKTANTLSIAAGRYLGDEICGLLSNWLGGELAAGRITGTFSWAFAVSSPQGPRTKCHWHIPNPGSASYCYWQMSISKELGVFLGLRDKNPADVGAYITFPDLTPGQCGTATHIAQGDVEPYRAVSFHFGGREGFSFQCELANIQGTWQNQTSYLPTAVKTIQSGIDANLSLSWGLVLIDGKTIAFCNYDASDPTTPMLGNVYVAPLPQATDAVLQSALVGRKVTDAGGPVTVKQILDLEGSLAKLFKQMAYSTGTTGFNHATYDTLGPGLGWDVPGELLGTAFEQSLDNMPGAQDTLHLLIDKPTKLSDLIGSDLILRRAILAWKNGGIRFQRLQTPISALAITTLNESNKAEPSGQVVNHRSDAIEDATFMRPIVTINYARDYSFSRGETYQASITLRDNVAVDDAGGDVKPVTINARNMFAQSTQAGGALESLFTVYLEGMPAAARPSRKIVRSIDQTKWESLTLYEIVDVEDSYARDPLTGMRNGPTRPASVFRITYDPGGPSPDGSVRPMMGEVELQFLDTHRGGIYGPAADIDDTASSGGFDHGYASATKTIRCKAHQYSESSEGVDASNFAAGDVILITEIDPSNTASPTQWQRTVSSVSGSDIVLTATLSSPAWDNTKKYRITYAHYSLVQTTQQDHVYEADTTDELIENLEVADHYAITHDAADAWTPNSAAPAEFIADSAYGDGKSHDVGYDTALVNLANATIDYKTARNSPILFTEYDQGSTSASSTSGVYSDVMYVGMMYFGAEQLTNDVWRYLTIAPWLKLDNASGATTGYLRVTIARNPPVPSPYDSGLAGSSYTTYTFEQPYIQNEWTTTSTTWATGSDWQVALNFKNAWGHVWIMIETENVQTRGLAKVVEGARNYNA